MLTQEKFDQGLEENCNLEQGDADFPEEIDFPLYDFLHKTPIWSLSTTLKEELAKYKRYVIQPAVTPLWILIIERGPSYEEAFVGPRNPRICQYNLDRQRRGKQVNVPKIRPYIKTSKLRELSEADQQGTTTTAEIDNNLRANAPYAEVLTKIRPRNPRCVQYYLDRQKNYIA
jgi:hypothetical protein